MMYKKGSNVKLSKNFHLSEFDCKCDNLCSTTLVDINLIRLLEALRAILEAPITITSGYRCEQHNRNIGGAKNSYHKLGMAADIKVKGYTPKEVATAAEELFGGLGIYPTWNHVDTKKKKTRWEIT